MKNYVMENFLNAKDDFCYSWFANELLFRGRPIFGEPLLNPRGTGWSLASYHVLLTQCNFVATTIL